MAPEIKEIKPAMCVIGAGPGGVAVAAAVAARDVPVVLIEKNRIGGENLTHGSVPAQALITAAERFKALRGSARFGIKAQRVSVDFGAVNAHVRGVIRALAPNFASRRLAGLGVQVIRGTAHFADPHTVVVGGVAVKARRFVIATGSSPVVPPIPGLASIPYLTDETVFDLAAIPRHLIVIGAGSTGLELAQIFRRLGSKVTVLEATTPLHSDDAEGVKVVTDALAREGIVLHTGVAIVKVGRSLAKIRVVVADEDSEETIEGSHLLIAAGRRPNLEELHLDAAGIRTAERGVVLDKSLRTTNKRVYAVGDAAGGPKYAHVADYHASVVLRHALFREPAKVNREIIPWVTYTDPELAQVGLLEEEARAHCGAIRVLRWPYRENARAQIERTTHGHIKVVTDRAGVILGTTIVGSNAGEAIAAWTLAISEKLNIRALAGLVVPYPSYAEVGKRAAMTYFGHGLTIPRSRRIMKWLRRAK
jgi:pyruvate/2-oxoglutarate dehydrogenase complex dihydrolipoamide dehydrogenase (E3) component